MTTTAIAATIKHVLLISVDGMHQSDLDWYVANHPNSTLAKLIHSGSEYTNAATSNPSDSDPGGTALMTGGNPKSTGVFYDVEYSHKVDEAGAACTPGQPATGGDVIYDSPDDALANVPDFVDPANGTFPSFDENGSIFANGVDTNPAAIMNLKFDPKTSLNSGTFPVDPKTCKPITPWDYLGDNTIFQVIHNAGLRTAWSDKHEVYASFNGPGSNGQSIDDLFSPEIDSQAVMPNGVPYPQDDDWAHIDAATKQYDGYKVQAILNEIDGLDHSGKTHVGTPAIFGTNFQTVSVAEKIRSTPTTLIGPDANGNYTTSAPEAGGYQWVNGQLVPGPVLSSALDYVDAQLGRMVSTIHKDGLAGSTTIIVTAKHGQSPQDPNELITVQDGPIISAINAAWAQTHPSNTSLIVAGTDDDLWQSYLSDNSQAACDFVKSYLWNHTAAGFRRQQEPRHRRALGPRPDLGRRCRRPLLRRLGRQRSLPGRLRRGPGGHRLREADQARRARWYEHRRPTRPDGRQRPGHTGSGRVHPRRDHPGRTDDPRPPGAQPARADGRPD